MRILLIEDETDLAHWLARALERHADFIVDWADDGLVAERRLRVESFDAIILDLGLPSLSGHELLKRLRQRDIRTPVLILTARDSLHERVNLLNQGADDFLAKPFELTELEARLHALIRRSRGQQQLGLRCGPLHYEGDSQLFFLNDNALDLSPRERAVLRVLLQRQGEPINKTQIALRVFSDDEDVHPEAVEVLIFRIRKKIANSGVRITTHRGLGYVLETDSDDNAKKNT